MCFNLNEDCIYQAQLNSEQFKTLSELFGSKLSSQNMTHADEPVIKAILNTLESVNKKIFEGYSRHAIQAALNVGLILGPSMNNKATDFSAAKLYFIWNISNALSLNNSLNYMSAEGVPFIIDDRTLKINQAILDFFISLESLGEGTTNQGTKLMKAADSLPISFKTMKNAADDRIIAYQKFMAYQVELNQPEPEVISELTPVIDASETDNEIPPKSERKDSFYTTLSEAPENDDESVDYNFQPRELEPLLQRVNSADSQRYSSNTITFTDIQRSLITEFITQVTNRLASRMRTYSKDEDLQSKCSRVLTTLDALYEYLLDSSEISEEEKTKFIAELEAVFDENRAHHTLAFSACMFQQFKNAMNTIAYLFGYKPVFVNQTKREFIELKEKLSPRP